jgi:hypothetical protein
MNRAFLVILVPAVFVAAMYLAVGIFPSTRASVGAAAFVAVLAAFRLNAMLRRGKSADQAATPAASTPPAAPPPAQQ